MAVIVYRRFKGEIQQIKIEPQFLQAHLNAGFALTRAELETPPDAMTDVVTDVVTEKSVISDIPDMDALNVLSNDEIRALAQLHGIEKFASARPHTLRKKLNDLATEKG